MSEARTRRRVVILGAAGRDFHDFNVLYRNDPDREVTAFTAAQIPGIAGRRYPRELSGPFHPDGIPIVPEQELEALCARERVDEVVFAYSDVTHAHVMHLASRWPPAPTSPCRATSPTWRPAAWCSPEWTTQPSWRRRSARRT